MDEPKVIGFLGRAARKANMRIWEIAPLSVRDAYLLHFWVDNDGVAHNDDCDFPRVYFWRR